MEIVEINRFDAQVPAADVNLMFEVSRRKRVAVGDNFFGLHKAGPNKPRLEVSGRISGLLAIIREKAALGGQQEFIALGDAGGDQFRDGPPHSALAVHVAIIDRGVEDVHSRTDRLDTGLRVLLVNFLSGFAQVSSKADGTEPESA